MSVITISRGSFSGGKALAACLAGKLGFRSIDRDLIVERAAAYGASQEELRDAVQKPPRFLERFQHKRYVYLALIQAALAEEVREGRAVYHGNAGHLLLKGAPILRVRVIAPFQARVAECQARLRITGEEAAAQIQRMDQDRRKWTHYLYGVDWNEPSLYDLVVNLETMNIQDACEAVATLACRGRYYDRAAFANLALASRVKASLAVNPSTTDVEVEVLADGPAVTIHGRFSHAAQIEAVERVARNIPGADVVTVETAW
ncbi:MAG: cytidylate kinase family protein [Bryobacteraceae bacterium]